MAVAIDDSRSAVAALLEAETVPRGVIAGVGAVGCEIGEVQGLAGVGREGDVESCAAFGRVGGI